MFQGSGVAGRMAHWMRDTVDCQVIYYLFMYVCMYGRMDGWKRRIWTRIHYS